VTTASLFGLPRGFTTGQDLTTKERWRRVWEYRRILRLLVTRDIKVRYAGRVLGYLWTVIEPLANAAIYWFVVTKIIHRVIGYPPFILFLVAGQLSWFWISGSVNGALGALKGESALVRSSNLPREIFVLRVVVSRGVMYVFSLPVLVIFALAYQKPITIYILLLPLAVLLTVVLSTGIGLILAPAAVLVPDVTSVVRIVMRVLFFGSPVLYSVYFAASRLHSLAAIVYWNPISGIMILYRVMFFKQEMDWAVVWHSVVISFVILAIGLWAFNRMERPMLKEL
jgi:ABC-2 type transport system permease protein